MWLAAQIAAREEPAETPPTPAPEIPDRAPPRVAEKRGASSGEQSRAFSANGDLVGIVRAPDGAAVPEPFRAGERDAADMSAEAPPLVHGREIANSFRPLKKRVDSRQGEIELDEEATAVRVAEEGLWLPESRLRKVRWLELDVVLDDGRFALLHRPQAEQLIDLIRSVGAFRDIRVRLMDTDDQGHDGLMLRSADPCGPIESAEMLAHPTGGGQPLILVLTDGVGEAWRTGAVQRVMAGWARSCPVAVIHLLPHWLWHRTGVCVERVELSAPGPAVPNIRYGVVSAPMPDVLVPVLEADPAQLGQWAEFVAGTRPDWRGAGLACPAVIPPVSGGDESDLDLDTEQRSPPSPADRVRQFRSTATPTAFRLAVHLAAAPLSLPLMRLVQRKLLPHSQPVHLAEVVGGGLLRLADGPGEGSTSLPQRVLYDFVDGVREELLAAGRRSETARVMVTIADHLADRFHVLHDVRKIVISPEDAAIPDLPADTVPLVRPLLPALRALAGPYASPARQLAHKVNLTSGNNYGAVSNGDAVVEKSRIDDSKGSMSQTDVSESSRVHTYPETDAGDSFGGQRRSSDDPVPVWNFPQRNIYFTGRESLLAALHERLSRGTTAVVPEALHGMGGVGKTHLTIEYVYRHIADYDLIWWIPSERPTSIRQAFVELGGHLGLDAKDPNVAVDAVRKALQLGQPYANWLLVFDNAEDPEEVRTFFPTNGPGKILVTSRNNAWKHVASALEVDVFTRQESRDLLRLRGPELGDDDADRVAELLGDLPLAIEQAAVWLAETGMPLSEYLQLFQEKADELLRDGSIGAERSVAAAWNVSLDRLRETQPAALQLLQVCAFFGPEPIDRKLLTGRRNLEGPPELVEALSDPIKLNRAIRYINQFALAKLNYRDNTIVMHRIVQHVLIGQMTPQEAAELKHCGHLLLAHADPGVPDSSAKWPDYLTLLPHATSSRLEGCDDPWARQLVLNLMDFLFRWGDNGEFRDTARRAFSLWTERLGAEHEQTLLAELRLGRALRMFGEFARAHDHHVHARDLFRESLGERHERTLEAQGYLGADLRYLGDFKAALELDEKTYEILRHRFGPDDPLTLEQAHLYAIDLRLTGDPWRARELDHDTYRRKAGQLGEDHLSTLSTLSAIALDETECGHYVQARDGQERLTRRFRALYGTSHPGTIACIGILSVTQRKAGNHQEALRLSQEALTLFRTRHGDGYPDTLAASLNHAVNLRHVGDLEGSVAMDQGVREHYLALFGPRHPNPPSADVNMAVTLRLMGRAEAARALDEAALRTLRETLGPEHPRSLICAINLASDMAALGDWDAALAQDQETLNRVREVLRDDHPTTLACAHNLSLDLDKLGHREEAEKLFSDTLRRYRNVLGADHPATVSAHKQARADCDIYPIPV